MQLPCPITVRSLPSTSDGPYPFRAGPTSEHYSPKKVVFCQAPNAMCRSMYGIGRPPPNTTERPKVVWWKPFTTCPLHVKTVTVHPATRQMTIVHLYPPNLTFTHKTKKPQIICLYCFFNCKPPYMHLRTSMLSTYVQLHPKDATEHPVQFPAYTEPFQPFIVSNHPVHSWFSLIPGI